VFTYYLVSCTCSHIIWFPVRVHILSGFMYVFTLSGFMYVFTCFLFSDNVFGVIHIVCYQAETIVAFMFESHRGE